MSGRAYLRKLRGLVERYNEKTSAYRYVATNERELQRQRIQKLQRARKARARQRECKQLPLPGGE
jgi:hypothetical protein